MNKTLSDLLNEFIEYKRQNRYDYTTAAYHLNKYLAFSTSHAPEESIPSKDSKNIFLNRYAGTPRNLYNIAAVLREFSKYLIGLGYMSAYIIPPGKVSLPMPVQPYLFTAEELDAFFQGMCSIKYDWHVPKRHIVLPTMYRLLYCCGLRCKEVRVLQSENVHLAENYIDILQSKGPKSRRIFISQELSEYLQCYDMSMNAAFPDRLFFFPSRKDSPYSADGFQKNFLKIWYTAFPEKKYDGVSIRAYDVSYPNLNKIQTFQKKCRDCNKCNLKRFGFYF